MYVKTSSVCPIETFVRTGEFNAARVKLYGAFPPEISMPIAEHVETGLVKFGVMVMFGAPEAAFGTQDDGEFSSRK